MASQSAERSVEPEREARSIAADLLPGRLNVVEIPSPAGPPSFELLAPAAGLRLPESAVPAPVPSAAPAPAAQLFPGRLKRSEAASATQPQREPLPRLRPAELGPACLPGDSDLRPKKLVRRRPPRPRPVEKRPPPAPKEPEAGVHAIPDFLAAPPTPRPALRELEIPKTPPGISTAQPPVRKTPPDEHWWGSWQEGSLAGAWERLLARLPRIPLDSGTMRMGAEWLLVWRRMRVIILGLAVIALVALLRSPMAPSLSSLEQWVQSQVGDQAAFYLLAEVPSETAAVWQGAGFASAEEGSLPQQGLTLHQESLTRTDYQFDFDVRLSRGGIGWVFRAANDANYGLYRLEPVRGGRNAGFRLLRSLVVNGEPLEPPTEIRLPESAFGDEFHRISTRVRGSEVAVLIDGLGVDYWDQDTLAAGGVGFLMERNDEAAVRRFACIGNEDNLGLFLWGAGQTWLDLKGLFP